MEPEMEPRPRLCFLIRAERGYGFHLHGERSKGGQFIRKVDPGSSAELAGLRPGDRVVEVNGDNVESETHHQVVNRIRAVAHRTRLLVVDRETDDYLRSRGLACTEELAVEMGTLSPRPSPRPTPCASPIPPGPSPIPPGPSPRPTPCASPIPPGPSPRPTPCASPIPPGPSPIPPGPSPISRESSPPSLKPTPDFQYPAADSQRSSETSSSATDTELQVEPSPVPKAELLPRLCLLVKGEHGYGFNLHSDKKKHGQFVRTVDPDSAAERAGVLPGDRVVEVNGENTGGLKHSEVVALIRAAGEEVRLLLVDQETDELFQRLGIVPTSSHIKEVYVDDRPADDAPPTPSPTAGRPAAAPIINVTLTDSPIKSISSPKTSRANGSSASQSSRSSTTQSEISSSDMSFQVPEEDERRVSDPFVDGSLRLSPTAAEAKQKALASRNKKKAPPMDWSKKQELFSNF